MAIRRNVGISRPNTMIGPTNQDDPRLQEALLREAAGGPKNLIGLSKRITAAHTGHDMGQRLAFARLAQNQRQFTDRLGLARKKLEWQNKLFKQQLHEQRQDLNRTMGLGLLTTGFGFLEGRRRKELTAQDNAERARFRKKMEAFYDSQMAKQYPPSGWAWTDEEQ